MRTGCGPAANVERPNAAVRSGTARFIALFIRKARGRQEGLVYGVWDCKRSRNKASGAVESMATVHVPWSSVGAVDTAVHAPSICASSTNDDPESGQETRRPPDFTMIVRAGGSGLISISALGVVTMVLASASANSTWKVFEIGSLERRIGMLMVRKL